MINRNIFTKARNWYAILDIALAVFIGLCLTIGALAYFDILI